MDFESMSSRGLASSSGSDGSDYTVALVAMVVVALILIVDCLREKLDHAVQHRPLSHQVVERCYRELTTLGVVEFLIFLVHEIDPDFPIDLEMKFGRVRSRRRADKTHIFFHNSSCLFLLACARIVPLLSLSCGVGSAVARCCPRLALLRYLRTKNTAKIWLFLSF